MHSCTTDVKFHVTSDGKVTFDKRFEGCLEVRAANRLMVNGLPVTVDARYAAMNKGKGVLFLGAKDTIVHGTINLLPGSYKVQQGSAQVSSFRFQLGDDGRFAYNPEFDVSHGGFLSGQHTSTLVFRGYPFLVDATAVGTRVNVDGKNLEAADNSVMFTNLLPMHQPFRIVCSGGEPGGLFVKLNVDGSTEQDPPGTVFTLVRDKFHGLARLTLVKR